MVKHSVSFMRRFLQTFVIGKPQLAAAALLLVYLAQCVCLVRIESKDAVGPNAIQARQIRSGLVQWQGGPVAGTPEAAPPAGSGDDPGAHARTRDGFDQDRSPLYYLTAAAPFLLWPPQWGGGPWWWHTLAAMPYLFFGVMLGASLWYVARRLYGNAGGYIALALYCFSPALIISVAGSHSFGEMGGVWGAFGAIWTAIAVAHTLYAPREVVLWNWRRILLLGLSFTLAVGTQFSLAILALVALVLMLWVAPVRKGAVFVIWGAAGAIALLLLFASYFFHGPLFSHGLAHARWVQFDGAAFGAAVSYRHLFHSLLAGSPSLSFALPATAITYLVWRRARYFGNTAPLLIAVLLVVLSVGAPSFPGQGFELAAIVFVFLFVAGVLADLLETRHRLLVAAALCGLLLAGAAWNLLQLIRLGQG